MKDFDRAELNKWLEGHKLDIVAPINEILCEYSSTYVYNRISDDEDSIEIWDIYDSQDHLCNVTAGVVLEIGELIPDQNGELWPDEGTNKGILNFYVDKDDNGAYSVSFDMDKDGKIDVDAAVSPEEPDFGED